MIVCFRYSAAVCADVKESPSKQRYVNVSIAGVQCEENNEHLLLAVLTTLLNGGDPCTIKYEIHALRDHTIESIRTGTNLQ